MVCITSTTFVEHCFKRYLFVTLFTIYMGNFVIDFEFGFVSISGIRKKSVKFH